MGPERLFSGPIFWAAIQSAPYRASPPDSCYPGSEDLVVQLECRAEPVRRYENSHPTALLIRMYLS